ncbi:hypothetical protein AB205_0058910 [Aquarana catesbeiana]|uniref:Myosin motor domain-containing protein n=1 Tax=Aquarana catesbeiana TaxID=8400 RepID=A0A2G9RI91_AQUCT|nr:hypothetical protein AB205_0058910 [Aquarana catesbeiana]
MCSPYPCTGLLDVYGFESFQQNNLEQLCINYANEKLQQHFVTHYLKIQQECRLNRSSDASQLQSRLEKSLSLNKCFGRDKFSGKPNFIVSHYAGKVTYQIEDMVEKNKDPVPPELIQLLQESKDSLLQKLFPLENNKTPDVATYSRTSPTTVVSKFKGSLESLMHILHNTTPHYIRCIKPNMGCKAMDFQKEERYGVVAPGQHKTEMRNHVNGLSPAKKRRGPDLEEGSNELQINSQEILEAALPKLYVDTTSTNTLAHCGTTKVFLTHTVVRNFSFFFFLLFYTYTLSVRKLSCFLPLHIAALHNI